MLHRRDGARFPPDVKFGIQAKEFSLGFIRPEDLVSHGLRVMVILLEGSPISTELHRGTMVLCQ
jgi:hypothetical protein